MVGLPARGKTFIARKVASYLSFFHGAPVRTFNVGEYRRRLGNKNEHAENFFREDNKDGSALRESYAKAAMDDMKKVKASHTSTGMTGIYPTIVKICDYF